MTLAEYHKRLGQPHDIVDHMVYLRLEAHFAKTVIELGVRAGNSTIALLRGVTEVGGHLWSCDVNPPDVPPEWLALPQWTFVQGDDLDPKVIGHFPPVVGCVFIDTSHDYDHTLAELQAYAPRATHSVLCHDTQWAPGDHSLFTATGPVAQALNTYCAEAGLAWENRQSAQGLYGLGVITK